MKNMVLLLIAAMLIVVTSTALASTGWRVFATSNDTGEYGTIAFANASIISPHALAVRTDQPSKINWSFHCSGIKAIPANGIAIVTMANAQKCMMYVTATSDSNNLRVQLLKK